MFKPQREYLATLFGKKPAAPYATLAEVTQAYTDEDTSNKLARTFMHATHIGMVALCGVGIALVTSGMALTVLPFVAAVTILPTFIGGMYHGIKGDMAHKRLRASEDVFGRDDMHAARPAAITARIENDHANKTKLDKQAGILSTVSMVGGLAVIGALFGAAVVGFGAMGAAVGSAAYVTAKATGFAAWGVFSLVSSLNLESSRLQTRKVDVMLHDLDIMDRDIKMARAELDALDDDEPSLTPAPATPAFDAAAAPKAADAATPDAEPAAPAKARTPKNKK